MDETVQPQVTKTDDAKETEAAPCLCSSAAPCSGTRTLWKLLAVCVLLGLAFLFLAGKVDGLTDPSPIIGGSDPVATKLALLEARVAELEKRAKADIPSAVSASALSATPSSASSPVQAAGEGDVEKLKSGLSGLSQALTVLQGELEKSAREAEETRRSAQAGVATVLAFTEMQRQALAGNPFETERQAMRTVIGEDPALIEKLLKIEPLALSGASSPAALAAEWKKASDEAQNAMRKAGAQTWFDRLLVAVEGLVSIRSLNPTAGDTLSFSSVKLDLEQGKLLQAHEKIVAFSPEVQAIVKESTAHIIARIELENQIKDIAAFLIERGRKGEGEPNPPPVEAGNGEPPVTSGTSP